MQWSNYAELKLWKYIDRALIKERVTVKVYRYYKITKGLHNLLENIDEALIMKYERKLIILFSWQRFFLNKNYLKRDKYLQNNYC